jgi:predicted nucleic acid-binding protein
MPANFVVDTSILTKTVFTEPGADVVRAWLTPRIHLVAPEFIVTEMASVACRKVKTGVVDLDDAVRLAEQALLFVQETDELETVREEAIRVAVTCGASFYDGLFVASAIWRQVPLVTADEKLAARVRGADLGIECLTVDDLARR